MADAVPGVAAAVVTVTRANMIAMHLFPAGIINDRASDFTRVNVDSHE
jgi:hypothetical protein